MSGGLPPGCRVSDIPGNRPEDVWYDGMVDMQIDGLFQAYQATYALHQDIDHHICVKIEEALIAEKIDAQNLDEDRAKEYTVEDLVRGPIRRVLREAAQQEVADRSMAHLYEPEDNPPVEDGDALVEKLTLEAMNDVREEFKERDA